MDLKSVELQIAVPRTGEASRIHQDQQQRPLMDQQQLAGQNVKHAEQQSKRSAGVDESAKALVREEERHSSNKDESNSSSGHDKESTESPNKTHPAEHPFKGKHIDLSL